MADVVQDVARQACTTCRKQKRKCTRDLPSCDLCKKNRRPCEYPLEALLGLGTPSLTSGAFNYGVCIYELSIQITLCNRIYRN